jgi:hypothetical protein
MLPGLQNLVAIVSALATSCIVAYVFEKSPSVFLIDGHTEIMN